MVVLPAPFGPEERHPVARADGEVDAVDGAHLLEGLHEAAGFQDVPHGSSLTADR